MSTEPVLDDIAIKISDPTRNMTLTYVISLSIIAALSTFVHIMLDHVIAEQNNTARVVNISGQQRMLSQRTSLFTLEYLNTGSDTFKTAALDTLTMIQENHQTLLEEHFSALQSEQPSPLSANMQKLYFEPPHQVDSQIKRFSDLVNQSLNNGQGDAANGQQTLDKRFWDMAKIPLLNSLNTVVSQYETESVNKVNELREAQRLVFAIILFTILIEAIFIFRPMVARVKLFANHLQREANFDYLTSLLNRRAFAMLAERAIARCNRQNESLSLVTFDIDHFKSVNDSYGHDVGDKAIQHISHIIKKNARQSDTVARFGGEEFVVLLSNTDATGSLKLANKIREKVENSPMELGDQLLKMTISGGIGHLEIGESELEPALKRADEALYRAKHSGRNQVCAA